MIELVPSPLLEELKRLENTSFANEAEVETKLLLHLFRLLGYTDVDRADKPPIEMYFGRERKTKYPDFILYDGKERSVSNALVTVEAKDTSESVESARPQARSYALWAGTPFYLACNGRELIAVQFVPATDEYRVLDIPLSDLSRRWNDLVMFLSRASAILAKERLAYTALYLPEIEKLPPREFFGEYLRRVAGRFSSEETVQPTALDASRSQLHIPNIEVYVHFDGSITGELDETRILQFSLSESARILVSGPPGSGKSTLLGRIAYQATQVESINNAGPLPVFVRLSAGIPESVESAFASACLDIGIRVLPNLYRKPLGQSHILLLLDGLDEVDPSDENLAKLAKLVDQCGANSIVLTTREAAMDRLDDVAPWDRFERGRVNKLSDDAVRNMFRAYLGERADAVLDSIPPQIRQNLNSPLLALMTIKVAQTTSDWPSFSQFKLFHNYVEVVDQFFNAATVRGRLAASPGRAVEDLSAVAELIGSGPQAVTWSLEALAAALRGRDTEGAVVSLVNIGLLTSSGGTARFAHQSLADFGVAYSLLKSIRDGELGRFTSVAAGAGAFDLLQTELTSADEEVLVHWLTINSSTVHRRVNQILRRGCSVTALSALRDLWHGADMINRMLWAARTLAANGDLEFLKRYQRHIEGTADTARSRILAKVLAASNRPEYFDTVRALARSKRTSRYVLALLRISFSLNRSDGLEEIVSSYSEMDHRTRLAIARVLTSYRHSMEFTPLLNQLLQIEHDPDVIFMLLYAGRDAISEVEKRALLAAANTLAKLVCSQPYQPMLAKTILESMRRSPVETEGVDDLISACRGIAEWPPGDRNGNAGPAH